MQRVHSHESLAYIGYLQHLLEQAGIRCIVKNEGLAGGLGEIPFLECWPELWVLDDGDLGRARGIIDQAEASVSEGGAWRCRQCGEENEAQFGRCWNCGEAVEEG